MIVRIEVAAASSAHQEVVAAFLHCPLLGYLEQSGWEVVTAVGLNVEQDRLASAGADIGLAGKLADQKASEDMVSIFSDIDEKARVTHQHVLEPVHVRRFAVPGAGFLKHLPGQYPDCRQIGAFSGSNHDYHTLGCLDRPNRDLDRQGV